MRKVDELRNEIANQFAYEYKAYDLEYARNKYGGYEFLDTNYAKQMLCEFFDKLFERYEIDL